VAGRHKIGATMADRTALDAAADQMDDATDHLRRVLLLAAEYVARRADEGDPEAAVLAKLIDGAWDRFALAGIVGRTALEEEAQHG
jgi:hypothetical protein